MFCIPLVVSIQRYLDRTPVFFITFPILSQRYYKPDQEYNLAIHERVWIPYDKEALITEAVKKEDGSRVLHKYMDGEQRLGGIGDYIAQELMKETDVECRVTTLGHVQRGAPPTASDRILASAFGVYAVDLLSQKKLE